MFRVALFSLLLLSLSLSDAQARGHRHHGRLPWCGFYMMHLTGDNKPDLAQARNWAREGYDAGGPGEGVIVVWRHHVGRIEGRDNEGHWLVHSGNDGGRVRTRVRSLAGAIAFRRLGANGWPGFLSGRLF